MNLCPRHGRASVMLAFVTLCLFARVAKPACIVDFPITDSVIDFTGGLTSPLTLPVQVDPSTKLGLSGSLYAQFPSASSCPLRLQSSGTYSTRLVVPQGASPLTVQPVSVPAKLGPYAVALNGTQFTLQTVSTINLQESVPGSAAVLVNIVAGRAVLQTSQSSSGESTEVPHYATNSTSVLSIELQDNQAVLQLDNLDFNVSDTFKAGTLSGAFSFRVTGNLTAKANLDSSFSLSPSTSLGG